METGMGPVIRVLRHLIERRSYYQLKFSSGEQALVLIAGMPAPSVELVRLALGGLVPWQTVWEYNPIKAGGYSDYIHKLKAMFSPGADSSNESFHYIRDVLLTCPSVEEARLLLVQRERLANSAANKVSDEFARNRAAFKSSDVWELGAPAPEHVPPVESARQNVSEQLETKRGDQTGESFLAEDSVRARELRFPNRYRIIENGKARVLTCAEAPTLVVRAERGLKISAKQARKFPAGAIFLDGAAEGDPFIDVHKEIYNLDHHEGCIRSLATCEQAIALLRKGLELSKRDWIILANDADLDTVLALWVFLNHLRLNKDSKARARIMPLIRLAGVIDAHGRDLQELTALPPDLLQTTSANLKKLQQQETVLKDYGHWSESDLLQYIADRLRAIDEQIYDPETFDGFYEVEELARAQIGNGSVAVACCSRSGDIDRVQRQLQRIYGERLGVLLFQNGPSAYSLRRVDPNLPAALERVYERLNLVDPAVGSGSETRWGGSADAGDSPRKNGTALSSPQIIEAIRQAFGEPGLLAVASSIPQALSLAVAALLPALALNLTGDLLRKQRLISGESVLLSTIVLALTVAILFWSKARRLPGLNGWRLPAGFSWLSALPAALIGAAVGGIWAPGSIAYRMGPDHLSQLTGATVLLLPLAAELLFRGVILGDLAAHLPMQKSGGSRWFSCPTLISSTLYCAASFLLMLTFSGGEMQVSQSLLVIIGAVIFGVASGVARERSESILASVLLHWLCTAALLLSRGLPF